MTTPRVDPDFTTKDLDKECAIFLKAGYRYWEAMHKAGMGGAVVWCNDTAGFGCVFTRGEYTSQLMANIERLGPIHTFGTMKDEA